MAKPKDVIMFDRYLCIKLSNIFCYKRPNRVVCATTTVLLMRTDSVFFSSPEPKAH